MAEETSAAEKTEPATPRKLEKAREEGQVARSRELTTFLLLGFGLAGLWFLGETLVTQLGGMMEQAFLFDRARAFEVERMLSNAWLLGESTLWVLMQFFMLLVLVALSAPMLLGGMSASAKALKPKFSRVSPVKGLKRIFSMQAVAELAKVISKAVLISLLAGIFMAGAIGEYMALSATSLHQGLYNGLALIAQACSFMILALLVPVLIDVPYQLWQHAKQLRMSKEEIKKEHKDSDGDPQIKARIRAQQQTMARRRMMTNVATADVIVTNPTHYAVALSYEQAGAAAPRVVAKGADEVAWRIRLLATEHDVPLLEAPTLARALYRHVDLDQEIPAELYAAVAEVMAWAFRLKLGGQYGSETEIDAENLPVPDDLLEESLA